MNKKKIILIGVLILIGAVVLYFALLSNPETDEEKAKREQLAAQKKAAEDEALKYKTDRINELKKAIPVTCWENIRSSTSNRPGTNTCAPYQSLISELQKLRGY